MDAIFTYPNNESTYYVDPDYVGDATTGFEKRIQELKDGTIFSWGTATQPTASVAALMTGIAKYYRFYKDTNGVSDNVTRHQMKIEALYENKMKYGARDITSFDVEYPSNDQTARPRLAFSVTPGNAPDLDTSATTFRLFNSGADDFSTTGKNGTSITWSKDTQYDKQSNNVAGTQAVTESISRAQLDLPSMSGPSQMFTIRNGSGSLLKSSHNCFASMSDGDAIANYQGFANGVTGDTDTEEELYIKKISGSDYTCQLYTDQALTTPASTDETLYGTHTLSLTGTGATQNVNFNGSSLSFLSDLQINDEGWARIYYQNLSGGTFTSPVDSDDAITSARDYSVEFYYILDGSNNLHFYDHRSLSGGNNFADFNLTLNETVDIVIEFIKPGQNASYRWYHWIPQQTLVTNDYYYVDEGWYNSTLGQPYYQLDDDNTELLIAGDYSYEYQNSSNVTTGGARMASLYYEPGQDAEVWDDNTNVIEEPEFTFQLNSDNQLTGITITDKGKFTNDQPHIRTVGALPDEYVPPAPTPAEIAADEDEFGTDDIWLDSPTASSGLKNWPRTPFKTVKVVQNQPSITTQSQTGIKFVRKGGFMKTQLEVAYPPLKRDEFMDLRAHSLLAQGQAAVFRFHLDNGDTPSKTAAYEMNNRSTWKAHVISKRTDNVVYTVEGFESNEQDATVRAQMAQLPFLTGESRDGEISLVTSENDANVYGEVQFRIAYAPNTVVALGDPVWMKPTYLAVSLREDQFEYVQRTDGLFDLTIKFDLDYYK